MRRHQRHTGAKRRERQPRRDAAHCLDRLDEHRRCRLLEAERTHEIADEQLRVCLRSSDRLRQLRKMRIEPFAHCDEPTARVDQVFEVHGAVPRVHIINGQVDEGLLAEVFSNEGIGTLVYANEYRQIRRARRRDIRSIQQLIQASVENELCRPRWMRATGTPASRSAGWLLARGAVSSPNERPSGGCRKSAPNGPQDERVPRVEADLRRTVTRP
jgi:hypothetical protein